MLPVMRAVIPRMGNSLPDKHRATNPIRQSVPLSGRQGQRGVVQAAQGLAGMGSGRRDALPDPVPQAPEWDAVGGGHCPRGDRTQISEAPQAVESLHKCALRGADFCLVLRSAPELNELRSFSDWGLPEEALLA